MDRFIAFCWRDQQTAATDQVDWWSKDIASLSPTWRKVLDSPGLRIFLLAGPDNAYRVAQLPHTAGIVVGALFERGREREGRIKRLSLPSAEAVIASNGGALLSGFWGDYVAFWRATPDGPLTVLNDPSGATPCFCLRTPDVDIFCSWPSDIVDLKDIRLSPDWNAIRAHLVEGNTVSTRTGLNGLREILPGERVTLAPGRTAEASWAWSPVAFAAARHRLGFDECQEQLREVSDACFAAWAQTCRNIVVRISGGLDSAIAAHRLRHFCTGNVTGLHVTGRGYESYELKLARIAAQHAGVDLLELDIPESAALPEALTTAPKLARPTRQVLGTPVDALLQQACEALGASAVMGGHGGDSLFLQRSLAVDVLSDFVADRGVGSGFWKYAYETSVLLQQPVWTTLRDAAARRLSRKSQRSSGTPIISPGRDLLLADAGKEEIGDVLAHPWVSEARTLPPAKAEHLRNMVALHSYQAVMGHGVFQDAIHPLISQPIVEFVLQTPAYMFSRQGVDRALERETFADAIPDAIARRTDKGFINHQLLSDMSSNAAFLREFLLDGCIVAHAGVDRAKVAQLLSEEHLVQGGRLDPLMGLIAAEAWARAWQ